MSDSDRFRVAFFVSGRGRLFQLAVRYAQKLRFTPVLLFLDERADPEVEEFARVNQIKCVRSDFKDRANFNAQMLQACEEAQPNLIMLSFNKLVPSELIQRFPQNIVNLHMSLLPAFRGFGAIKAAIKLGVGYVGATMHLVNENVDDGAIVSQCAVGLSPEMDESAVSVELGPLLAAMYLQTLVWFRDHRVQVGENGRLMVSGSSYKFSNIVPNLEAEVTDLMEPGVI